ncbi:LysM peptidoglycan-binding domain-containing protein [Oerskovia sp. NPDC060338]|uniref:LysM peptidoglycan-binding domain-containing protein n=1 Tax=Oerskovia sp. NPDC060338 TaxID=3347100 RepID=UPI0036466421
MTQQSRHAQDGEHDRRAPRLAALVALSTAGGLAAALLAGRGLRMLQSLPAAHVEVYLEILVLAVGAALAAWVALTSAVALVCLIAQSVGQRWETGERLVRRHAPAAVRRLASVGVSLSVGAGLTLGAGSAQATELPYVPEDSTSGPVVDLGWQPTTPTDGPVGDEQHLLGKDLTDATSEDVPPAPPLPAPGPRSSAGDHLSAPAADSPPGQDPSAVPEPVPTVAASRSAAPPSEPSTAPAPHTAARSPHAPTIMDAPPTGRPDGAGTGSPQPPHTPLGTLLGSPAQTAAPSPTTTSDPTAPAPTVVEIVVLRGDTLWSIAGRSLGPNASDASVATECRRWFDANRDVIGDDPDLIKPGQILSAPLSP